MAKSSNSYLLQLFQGNQYVKLRVKTSLHRQQMEINHCFYLALGITRKQRKAKSTRCDDRTRAIAKSSAVVFFNKISATSETSAAINRIDRLTTACACRQFA
jgi:hypothetical protein